MLIETNKKTKAKPISGTQSISDLLRGPGRKDEVSPGPLWSLGPLGAWSNSKEKPAVPSSRVFSYKTAAVETTVRTPEKPREGLKYYSCCDLNINMTISLYPQVGKAWHSQITNII